MLLNCRVARIGAALIFPCGLLSAGLAAAQQPPHLVANPYFADSVTPPAAHLAASNAPAAIPTTPVQQVVYPAAATTSWQPSATPRGLPRHRAAALGAAVRVATLDEAYRAGVPASDGPAVDARHLATADAEPARFIPPVVAKHMPSEPIAASTTTAATNSGFRRDSALQPVVWMSDVPAASAPSPTQYRASPATTYAAPQTDSSQVGNPLRREFMNPPASPSQVGGGEVVGNPLR